jgi:hypothetical protein
MSWGVRGLVIAEMSEGEILDMLLALRLGRSFEKRKDRTTF